MAVEENKKTSTCAYSKTSIRFVNLLECGKLRNHHDPAFVKMLYNMKIHK